MSGKFGGFSQDDINKIKTTTGANGGGIRNKENATKTPSHRPLPPKKTGPPPPTADQSKSSVSASNHRLHHQSDAAPSTCSASASASTTSTQKPAIVRPSLSSAQQLHDCSTTSSSSGSFSGAHAALQDALHFRPLGQSAAPSATSTVTPSSDAAGSTNDLGLLPKVAVNQPNDQPAGNNAKAAPAMKGVSLREFEAQRRMVEEQNNHKKQMLYKVIEQHSERTAAEAKKLDGIKHELAKLELDLANDVSILRKQIDTASLRYMKARDHYMQVESVFLKAKLELQQTREKQDMLAEHLNIIIANNEDRKASKLSELMAKIDGLSSNDETTTVAV